MEHKQFMGEIKAYMMKMIKYAVICIIILGIFGNIAGAQTYIRVYDVIGGQLYGQLENYDNDTTKNCVSSINLTANDTLYNNDCMNQLVTIGSTAYTLYLDTAGVSEGKIFKIKNNNSAVLGYYFELESCAGTKLDEIFPNDIKYYIYTNNEWRSYAIGTGDGTSLQALSIGKFSRSVPGGVAAGYDARAESNGVAVGRGADGYSSGIAIGYGASGYGSGVAIGYIAGGDTKGLAIGRETIGSNRGVALGYQARSNNDGVAIGHQAGANNTTDDKLYIDNTNTTTPLIYGEFDTDYIKINDSLAVNSLSGTGNRVVLSGSDGQLISGDTITAYTMPSGTLSQTLRHNGTDWAANDIFRISDTPNLTFIGSGSVERLKINPGGEIITSSMVGTGVRNVVVDATGELKAGFGSYSVAVVQGTADTNSTTTLSNTSLSYTISDEETWVVDIYLYITKIDTSAANVKIQIQKTSGALISAISQVSVSYLNYNTGVSPMTNSFVRDLSASAFVYNLQSGNTEATIIKIRSVLINDANAGTVIVKFAPTTAGLLLQVDKSSNLTATKVQ